MLHCVRLASYESVVREETLKIAADNTHTGHFTVASCITSCVTFSPAAAVILHLLYQIHVHWCKHCYNNPLLHVILYAHCASGALWVTSPNLGDVGLI